MKIGDVVAQCVDLVELRGDPPAEILGIVVDIHDWKKPENYFAEECFNFHEKWLDNLGRRIEVMWAFGRTTKSFAEASLSVVDESW